MPKVQEKSWDSQGTKSWFFYCPGCGCLHAAIDGRWTFNGNFDSPTFSPSILNRSARGEEQIPHVCHIFVTDGKIQYLSDCTHELAGITVDMLEPEDW